MSTTSVKASSSTRNALEEPDTSSIARLLHQYGCGPIPFVGSENAFYERHLVFDRVIDPQGASARERFEALSHAIRDILAQRWVLTKSTYEKTNAKRVYYLSMEFLTGRALANNITNLLLTRWFNRPSSRKASIGLRLSTRNRMRVSGTEVWAASPRASWTRWPRCSFQPRVTVCATSTACLSNRLWMDGKRRTP